MARLNHDRQNYLDRVKYNNAAVSGQRLSISKIKKRSVTGKQGLIMEDMLYNKNPNEKEKEFLRRCLKMRHLSKWHRGKLNELYKKLEKKV